MIQDAINNATSGQTVVIVNNSYQYNESVVVNVTGLKLTSNTSTRPVVWSNSTYPTLNVSANNVSVENIYFIHNRTSTTSSFGVVDAMNVQNVTLVNLNISHMGGYEGTGPVAGLRFVNVNSSSVSNSGIYAMGNGTSDYLWAIYLSESRYNNLTNIVAKGGGMSIQSNINTVLYLSGGSNNRFSNATLDSYIASASSGPGGMSLYNTNYNLFENVTFVSTGYANQVYGLFTSGASNNKFLSFSVTSSGGSSSSYAIAFWWSGSSSNNEFWNSVVTGSSAGFISQENDAISNQAGTNNTFYNSRVTAPHSGSGTQGISVSGGTDITLYNTTYDDYEAISSGKIYFARKLDINVTNRTGSPLNGITVTMNDTSSVADSSNPYASGSVLTTNTSGKVRTQFVTEYYETSGSSRVYFNNHTIVASGSPYNQNSTSVNVTQDTSINLIISLTPNISTIFGKGANSYELGYDSANQALYTFVNGVNASGELQSGWSHIVMTFDSGSIRLYVNGRLTGTASTSSTPTANTRSLMLGNGTDLSIDEVTFRSGVLSQSVIEQRYQVGPGLKATVSAAGSGSFGRNFNISAATSDGSFSNRYITTDSLLAGTTQSVNLPNITGVPSTVTVTSNSCNQVMTATKEQLIGVYC